MFVSLKYFLPIYEPKSLFLLLSVRLRTISIFGIKVLANWAAGFTWGLFYFGYLLDSGANDPRLFGAHECELKDAAGETRAKETVPVAKKHRSTNGAIRVGGIASMFPEVCLEKINFFSLYILRKNTSGSNQIKGIAIN